MPFAVTDNDLPVTEINILYPQPDALHYMKACSVQQLAHNPSDTVKLQKNVSDLFSCENNR
jgi:hypothetical protein